MKKITKITRSILPVLVLLATFACKETKTSQDNSEPNAQSEVSTEPTIDSEADKSAALEFKEKNAQEIYLHYSHVRTALVNGDEGEVTLGAEMLMKNTEDEALQSAVQTIIDATDISSQREAFATISLQMESLFKQNISSGTLYKQFCPMALNNEGAYWFSEVKEIRNPYFGDQMLKCGSVVETFN